MAGIKQSTLSGARELDSVLKKLPAKIGQKVLLSSLRAGANVVRQEARIRAPVRTAGALKGLGGKGRKGRLPGFLRASVIVTKDRKSGASAGLRIGPSRKAFYGLFQEFGTVNQPARPWLRPAWDASKRKALDTIGKKLGNNVEKAAEKLAGPLAKSGLVKRRRRR